MGRRKVKRSSNGKGFNQPTHPHRQWHVDISYINIAGTFYYLCTVLDGYSRYLLHWENVRQCERKMSKSCCSGPVSSIPTQSLVLSQRAAIDRQGLQAVHPDQRDDARQNVTLLSPKQRQAGTFPPNHQSGLHSTRDALDARRCATARDPLRTSLLPCIIMPLCSICWKSGEFFAWGLVPRDYLGVVSPDERPNWRGVFSVAHR